jgi:hypothetical protein
VHSRREKLVIQWSGWKAWLTVGMWISIVISLGLTNVRRSFDVPGPRLAYVIPAAMFSGFAVVVAAWMGWELWRLWRSRPDGHQD